MIPEDSYERVIDLQAEKSRREHDKAFLEAVQEARSLAVWNAIGDISADLTIEQYRAFLNMRGHHE